MHSKGPLIVLQKVVWRANTHSSDVVSQAWLELLSSREQEARAVRNQPPSLGFDPKQLPLRGQPLYRACLCLFTLSEFMPTVSTESPRFIHPPGIPGAVMQSSCKEALQKHFELSQLCWDKRFTCLTETKNRMNVCHGVAVCYTQSRYLSALTGEVTARNS